MPPAEFVRCSAQQYPGSRVDAVETVSGKVSEELARDGALAIALAMLGIAIYIWFRFEWQFGVGALLTLFHDVSMTLGFFAFTRLQVDLNVVAAFLTIVGYSLNDTVVIYDRIRENLRKYRKMAIVPLLNLSLNETLARTVVTSLTDADRAWRADADRPGGHLRPGDRDLPRRLRSAPIRRSTSPRRSWCGSESSPTASSSRREGRSPEAQPA